MNNVQIKLCPIVQGYMDIGIQLIKHSVLNFPEGPVKLFGGIQIAEVPKAVFQADQIKIWPLDQ